MTVKEEEGPGSGTLSQRSAASRALAAGLVLLSAACLGLGVSLPLVTLDRLWFFTEEPSLLEVVRGLWEGGDVVLAGVVALVSLAFPVVKLAWLQCVATGVTTRGLRRLHALGRWSMMDVLVVALVVFGAKTSGLAEAVARPGLWFYAVATLSAAAAAILLERAAEADVKHRRASGPT